MFVACQGGTSPTAWCEEPVAYDASLFMELGPRSGGFEASFSGQGLDRRGAFTSIDSDGEVELLEEYVIKDGVWYGREVIDTGREMDGPDKWAVVSRNAERDFLYDAVLFCAVLVEGQFDEYWADEDGRAVRVRAGDVEITYSGIGEPNEIEAPCLDGAAGAQEGSPSSVAGSTCRNLETR